MPLPFFPLWSSRCSATGHLQNTWKKATTREQKVVSQHSTGQTTQENLICLCYQAGPRCLEVFGCFQFLEFMSGLCVFRELHINRPGSPPTTTTGPLIKLRATAKGSYLHNVKPFNCFTLKFDKILYKWPNFGVSLFQGWLAILQWMLNIPFKPLGKSRAGLSAGHSAHINDILHV
jgi:hypothetical protein